MKRAIITISVLLAIHWNATAQMESSGTIIYIQWSQNEIVLASDSRVATTDSYSDTACKISTLGGKVVFGGSGKQGLLGSGGHDWSGLAIANREFMRLTQKGAPDQLTMKLAEAWGEAVKVELQKSGPLLFVGLEKDNPSISAGLFAEFEKAGDLSIVVEDIILDPSAKTYPPITASAKRISNEPGAHVLGHDEIIKEMAAAPTTKTIPWHNELGKALRSGEDPIAAGVIEVVQLTIDNLPKTKTDAEGIPFSVVGPPVAAIRLSRGKAPEWIRQGKCPAQQ
jgi:hypothetical protein